jgi:hypothetical protein
MGTPKHDTILQQMEEFEEAEEEWHTQIVEAQEQDGKTTNVGAATTANMAKAVDNTWKMAMKWKTSIVTKQLNELDYQSHMDQLADVWMRADVNGRDGLDVTEFKNAFHDHFVPWKMPVDKNIAGITLSRLFMKIDANGDGRVDWAEFSDFVMCEAMQSNGLDKEEIDVFAQTEFFGNKEPGQQHKDMITDLVIVKTGRTTKYVTCSRDGTIRVWNPESRQLLHTIRTSEKAAVSDGLGPRPSCPAWVTGVCEAVGFESPMHPFGLLAAVSADRYLRLYDTKTYAFVSSVPLADDVSPLCCWYIFLMLHMHWFLYSSTLKEI